jgi:hypothetical protein
MRYQHKARSSRPLGQVLGGKSVGNGKWPDFFDAMGFGCIATCEEPTQYGHGARMKWCFMSDISPFYRIEIPVWPNR